MYCPKCGTENPDGAEICRNCSRVIMSAEPAASSPHVRTSALAITSLVLGLLSFCTFFLTAPLAIILGIISLFMITKSHGQLKGTGMAIAGIAVPIVMLPFMAILMGILMPALGSVKIVAQRIACGTNMAALNQAMINYVKDKNMYPDSEQWCDLLIEHEPNLSKKMFRCPCDQKGPSSYALNKNVVKSGANTPPDMVLLFESNPGWNQSGGPELLTTKNHNGKGCNVTFCNGRIAFVQTEDINKLRWTTGP
ncbi:MAG: DUF4190 domain-containing protein [Sedimentisphaerales bacterium]